MAEKKILEQVLEQSTRVELLIFLILDFYSGRREIVEKTNKRLFLKLNIRFLYLY